ncbi:MAG: YidC/Oxa1 family membrane protein insertase [Chloroflexi bacterium]|nr:MAG: YidC/Oxa1 family membrane protein insertase [Chloroflexota bacterium]
MISILAAGFFGIEHFSPPWDVIYLPLFNLLVLAYRLIFSDFALAIIVFTVAIRTVLAPLFAAQIRQQKEMQRMQPLIREVQRKHKGNSQKIQQEQMALYREHGVNPLGGCLPLAVQMPILIILYQVLIRASNVVTISVQQTKDQAFIALQRALPEIKEIVTSGGQVTFHAPVSGPCNLPQFDSGAFTHFLPLNCQLLDPLHLSAGIKTTSAWLMNPLTGVHLDLAQPDHAFALVIGGFGLSLLAVIAGILQFVQVKMTAPPSNPDDATSSATSTMTYLFPLLTVFWGGIFASGLILYWVVYTAYLVVHQFLIMGWGNLFPILGWSPGWVSSASRIAAGGRGANPDPRPPPSSGPRRAADPPASPNPAQSAQGQRAATPQRATNPQRPAERRPGGKKKRGRRR